MPVLSSYWVCNAAIVLLPALLAAYIYIYMTRNFNHWMRKGVVEIPPIPFFGNFFDCCILRKSVPTVLGSFYKRGKGSPYLGFYIFDKPALLLRDPAIIKRVLVQDFSDFADRYVKTHESDTVGAANMFLVQSPKWKSVRNKVSPIFTSGRMKKMFQLMKVIGEDLVTHLDNRELPGDGRVMEIREICERYTTDVITSCAFGLRVDSLNDPKSIFREYGTKIFGSTTYKRSAELAAIFFTPYLGKLLKLKFFSQEASDFMRKLFNDTMNQRLKSNTYRNDLIDLLIEIKKSHDHIDDPDNLKMEGDMLVGQAATFFAAGFESSSSVVTFTLYELALHLDVQSRLRDEIIAALAETGGEITYEMVTNLPYLDMVVSETLRKYPSLPFLDRVALRDYKVPDGGPVIEKGTPVYIPLFGLHYDPEYFPEPENYDPERFSDENKQKIPPYVYMPFGAGPHICVGLRFGLLASKLGVLKFILNHEVTATARTPTPLRYDPKSIVVKSKDRIVLNVKRIDCDINSQN